MKRGQSNEQSNNTFKHFKSNKISNDEESRNMSFVDCNKENIKKDNSETFKSKDEDSLKRGNLTEKNYETSKDDKSNNFSDNDDMNISFEDFNKENVKTEKDEKVTENFNLEEDDDLFDKINEEDFKEIKNPSKDDKVYRCLITKIFSDNNLIKEITVQLQDESNISKTLRFKDSWLYLNYAKIGAFCNIINPLSTTKSDVWLIDDSSKCMFILEPDYAIACTTLTNLDFCQRKSVLSTFYQSSSNLAMVLGTAVHSLFEKCCELPLLNQKTVEQTWNKVASDKNNIYNFYEVNNALNETDLKNYKDNTLKWLSNQRIENKIKIADIEDCLISTKYGMRGNIDITTSDASSNKLSPLELKTGRDSINLSHSAQVILYCMMLQDNYSKDKCSNNGQLLYLKSGVTRSVENDSMSVRSIFQARNLYVLSYISFISNRQAGEQSNCLPEPIHNRFCDKCEHLTTCSIYAKISDVGLPDSHLTKKQAVAHLKLEELNFFEHWISMVITEEMDDQLLPNKVMEAVVNKHNNKSYSIMHCDFIYSNFVDQCHYYTFQFDETSDHNLKSSNYVMISLNNGSKVGVLQGYVNEFVGSNRVVVRSYNKLKCDNKLKFRIDMIHSNANVDKSLTTISRLLSNKPTSNMLRNIIINKVAEGNSKFINHPEIDSIKLDDCNSDQIKAIKTTLDCKRFSLVKGFPGTGKTSCIVRMILAYVELGKRVLVSAYTHSAVKNILTKLAQVYTNFIYVTEREVTEINLTNRTLSSIMNGIHDFNQLEFALNRIKVFGVTCLSSDHSVLSRLEFDLVILDEAGQITLPVSLMPLLRVKSGKPHGQFVMFGDVEQLPPLVTNREMQNIPGGLNVSLFEQLCCSYQDSVVQLTIQYRMNRQIMLLANQLTYDNQMKCAHDGVALATIKKVYSNYHSTSNQPKFIQKSISVELDDSVIFLDVANQSPNQHNVNIAEADIIKQIVAVYRQMGVDCNEIGIIAPFRDQVDHLIKVVPDVEINTVDQYQGRDKSIILISFTKSSSDLKPVISGSILNDSRRINVAITRAKYKLILIGDMKHLRNNYETIQKLIEYLPENSIINC